MAAVAHRFNYLEDVTWGMRSNVEVVTNFRCPFCKKRLVIEEMQNVLMFGCPKCQCYVIVTENRLKEYVYLGRFSWRRFMKDLFVAYIEARRYICE